MVFTIGAFSEVAMERVPEWDVNPRPLNSIQKPTELSDHKFNWHLGPTLYSYSSFVVCLVSDFISALLFIAFVSRHVYFNGIFLEVITSV